MNKKLLLTMFLGIFMLNLGFATTNFTIDNFAYWTFDNTMQDSSPNSNDATNHGATYTSSGHLGGAYDFSNDYVDTNFDSDSFTNWNAFTMSIWIKNDKSDYTENSRIFGSYVPLTLMIDKDTDKIRFAYKSLGGQVNVYSQNVIGTGSWKHIVVTWNGNNLSMYINGVLKDSELTSSGIDLGTTNQIEIGSDYSYYGGTLNRGYIDGKIDEIGIWNTSFTAIEIEELYNLTENIYDYTPEPVITKPIITNTTLTNGTYYNHNDLYINSTASQKVNWTRIINGVNRGTYNNFVTFQDYVYPNTFLVEGLNNYTYNITNENGSSQYYYNFNVDTTLPVITDTLPAEINSYLLNISNYVSCSDSNLKTCNITFQPDSATALVNQTSLYNFTYNGNQNYNIIAEDQAGNIVNKSGVILVNPYAYFQFNNSGTLLTDYTFGGTLWTNTTAKFTLYNSVLTVGTNNTINFSKIGYLSQSFTQEVLNTSRINVTFNVSQAEINVNIYDKSTLALISGINFSLEFIGSVGTSTSTTTGTKTISNLFFLNEQYNLIVGNANYQTERVVFDFNNEENLTLNVYMVESNFTNLGYVQVKVLNLIGQSIAGATVQALQWDSTTSAYLKVSETQTGEDGIGNLNIILDDKFYIFKAFTNSVNSVNSTPQIINTIQNGKIIFLTLQDSQTQITGLLQGVSSSVTEVYSKSSLQSNVTFTWTNRYGGALTPCINVYRYTKTGDKNIISSSCATPSSSGVLLKSYIINSSYDIVIIGEYQLVGGGYLEIDSFLHYGELNINNLIEDFGLQYYILILVFILCVYVIVERSILIGTGMLAGLSGISIFLIPTILSKSVLTFVMFICVAIIISIIRGDK